jgi:hypothetical protein
LTNCRLSPGIADDPFDEVSGTLGITGAADSIFVLDRNRGEGTAAMYVTGRDVPDQTYALAWDENSCLWSITGMDGGITRIEKSDTKTKVGQCAIWLKGFIGTEYAWPDDEVLAAAKAQSFSENNVKEAKAVLRKESPSLCSKPSGSGGKWWNWIGDKDTRLPPRQTPFPVTGIRPLLPIRSIYSHASRQTRKTSHSQ